MNNNLMCYNDCFYIMSESHIFKFPFNYQNFIAQDYSGEIYNSLMTIITDTVSADTQVYLYERLISNFN